MLEDLIWGNAYCLDSMDWGTGQDKPYIPTVILVITPSSNTTTLK